VSYSAIQSHYQLFIFIYAQFLTAILHIVQFLGL